MSDYLSGRGYNAKLKNSRDKVKLFVQLGWFPAISGTRVVTETGALGIIETFSVASIIEAADAAVKAAP
jgi:hypothetical protein